MRAIGGELEHRKSLENIYFTDSGRSSLRLFLRTKENSSKKYLLPDFLCAIIIDIFKEEKINYKFYKVFEDLTIDKQSIDSNDFDVFYNINYFGQYTDLTNINLTNKTIIEDNVFFYDFENRNNYPQWFGFNSFRKISELADGSIIKTNLAINENLINQQPARFSEIKYEAKKIKFDYLNLSIYEESDYLKMLEQGETTLNNQKNIYSMSAYSQFLMMQKSTSSNIIEERRFQKLFSLFKDKCINPSTMTYSFFVMCIKDRDTLREKLFKKSIFLPIHWPKSTNNNILYDKVISIPLFHNYSDKEFDYMVEEIRTLIC